MGHFEAKNLGRLAGQSSCTKDFYSGSNWKNVGKIELSESGATNGDGRVVRVVKVEWILKWFLGSVEIRTD